MVHQPPSATLSFRRESVAGLMLRKQHLNSHSAADAVLTVLKDLLGLHATHPQSPYPQLRARMTTFAAGQLDAVLDEGRSAKLT